MIAVGWELEFLRRRCEIGLRWIKESFEDDSGGEVLEDS
jgi:hypothetical protein